MIRTIEIEPGDSFGFVAEAVLEAVSCLERGERCYILVWDSITLHQIVSRWKQLHGHVVVSRSVGGRGPWKHLAKPGPVAYSV